MIEIQIQLSTASVLLFISSLIAVAPAVLGLILGISCYSSALNHVKIPVLLTGSSAILLAASQFSGVLWSFRIPQVGILLVSTLIMAGGGLYYVCERITLVPTLSSSPEPPSAPISQLYGSIAPAFIRVEIAFICLWLVSLMMAFALTTYFLCLAWDEFQANKESIEADKYLDGPLDIPYVPSTSHMHNGSGEFNSVQSWTSRIPTINSIDPSLSFRSLQSALDEKDLTALRRQDSHSEHHKRLTTNQNQRAFSIHGEPNCLETPKSSRSPLKVHLNKSSFSLRRSTSKSGLQPQTQQVTTLNNEHPTSHKHQHPGHPESLQQLDIHALGISHGISSRMQEQGPPKNWVIIPNENATESRSVSGSSQLTGRIFPASEYNRKINSAGFQKDEPVPVQLSPSRLTFSQYDLERISRTRLSNI